MRQQHPNSALHWVMTNSRLYDDFVCGFGLVDLFLAELLLLFSFRDDVDAVDLFDLSLLVVAVAAVFRCRACNLTKNLNGPRNVISCRFSGR